MWPIAGAAKVRENFRPAVAESAVWTGRAGILCIVIGPRQGQSEHNKGQRDAGDDDDGFCWHCENPPVPKPGKIKHLGTVDLDLNQGRATRATKSPCLAATSGDPQKNLELT